ncbi:heme-binding protein [Sulfurivirga caldicuralii]|uniref:heme-binding protein n=1 Tax=Sulfurivirga caldicuralii TaxID=364032 RepID=UPI000A031182
MVGGVPLTSDGVMIGAIGVSGAPGGEKDEACALKAIEALEDRLEGFSLFRTARDQPR